MEKQAKLIYKTHASALPTIMPVYYYGMPDGHVYLIYSRMYEVDFNSISLEFVIALHHEFGFDYESEQLISFETCKPISSLPGFCIDKPDPKIRIIKVSRKIRKYSEALQKLEKKALKKPKKLRLPELV